MVWFLVSARLAVPVLDAREQTGTKAIRSRADTLPPVIGGPCSVPSSSQASLVSIASASSVSSRCHLCRFPWGTPLAVVADFFVQTISYVVFAPLSAAILVVLTIDLRVRKEGFDIQLLSTGWASRRRRPLSTSPSTTSPLRACRISTAGIPAAWISTARYSHTGIPTARLLPNNRDTHRPGTRSRLIHLNRALVSASRLPSATTHCAAPQRAIPLRHRHPDGRVPSDAPPPPTVIRRRAAARLAASLPPQPPLPPPISVRRLPPIGAC